MFIRLGEATIISVLNKDNLMKLAPKVAGKEDFCTTGTCPFQAPAEFEYDPERYLYFRARAITAEVANKNGDFFEWDELKKACPTFVGKGFYLNHESDHPSKAKGLILDAKLVEDDAAKYIETLVAVDRVVAPEVCQLIEGGIINSVSMGCLAAKAKCSLCSNIATNMETLCDHMNPQSHTYVKGRSVDGKTKVFEYNYDISFTELSGVSVPADSEAHIFEIFASAKPSEDLTKHYELYRKAAEEKESKKDKKEEPAKPSGRPESKAPDSLADAIDKVEDQMPKKVIEFLMKYMNDSVMKLLKVKLGDEAAALQAAISDELAKEIDLVSEPLKSEIKKLVSTKPESKTSDKLKEEPKPMNLPKPEELKPAAPVAASFDLGWFKKTYVEPVEKNLVSRKSEADVIEVKPEQVLNVEGNDTISLQFDANHGLYRIIEDGKDLPGFVLVKPDDIENKKIKEKTESMDLILRILKGKERSEVSDIGGTQMEVKPEVKQEVEKVETPSTPEVTASSTFDVIYVPGFTPASSFFVGRDGDKAKTISAAFVMPKDVQEKLLEAAVAETAEDPADIVTPEEVIEQIKTACGNNFDEFTKWAESVEKEGLSRTAEWAMAEKEIMDVPKPKAGEVIYADDSKEAAEGKRLMDMPSDQSSKVKQYYNRLPTSGPGETEKAINLQSDVNDKYHKLVEAFEKEKSEKEAAITALENLKKSGEEQERESLVASIVSTLQANKKIANEDEKKEVVAQLAGLGKEALVSMVKLLEKTSGSNDSKSPAISGENLPQLFASFEDAKTAVETMSDIWNK